MNVSELRTAIDENCLRRSLSQVKYYPNQVNPDRDLSDLLSHLLAWLEHIPLNYDIPTSTFNRHNLHKAVEDIVDVPHWYLAPDEDNEGDPDCQIFLGKNADIITIIIVNSDKGQARRFNIFELKEKESGLVLNMHVIKWMHKSINAANPKRYFWFRGAFNYYTYSDSDIRYNQSRDIGLNVDLQKHFNVTQVNKPFEV